MNLRSVLTFVLIAVAASSARAADPITPTDVIKLLDGGDLSKHWYVWLKDSQHDDPKKVFTVAGGMLHISGDGLGCIATKEAYRDYHLVTEFRFGSKTWPPREEKTKDTGILVHSFGPDGAHGGAWMRSVEAQVIQTKNRLLVRVPHPINHPKFGAAALAAFHEIVGGAT